MTSATPRNDEGGGQIDGQADGLAGSRLNALAEALPAILPLDEHNQRLAAHVHPTDWVNPTPSGRYNLVVLGAGTAGLVTAAGAAGLGARVALVERALMGGDCLNVGCVPSKAVIRASRAVAEVRRAARYGVRVGGPVTVDFAAVMERMRRLRAHISKHDSARRFAGLGVDVFIGEGRFTGPSTLEVGGQTLHFSKACVATGGRPLEPPIPGLHEAGFLTNETIFSLTELPARLAVVGAGPIGCELAQAFARFGTEVHLVEMAEQILIREDRDGAEIIRKALVADGVHLTLGAKVVEVGTDGAAKVVIVETAEGRRDLAVDEILMGVGRAPNVEGIGLEEAGVEYDKARGVHVDDGLRTSNRNVYAAGDVCCDYQFTHTADALARMVLRNALFFGRARASRLTIPWCTYTDPEIAHVGLYPREADERGVALDTFRVELSEVDRAILDGDEDGFLKIHVARGKDTILGATLVSRHAGETISEVTLAMVGGTGLGAISGIIHPYPTQADIIKRAGDAYSRTRLTPFVKKVFEAILRWRR